MITVSAGALAEPPRVLDAFDSLEAWTVIAAEGVRGAISSAEGGVEGRCLRLDFEFVTGGGYCIVQRALPIDLPGNYEFAFHVRADPGTLENNLEFKLLDESGLNVWWVNRRAMAFPAEWRRVINRKRQIEFAWGPAGAGSPLTRVGKVELVIASSRGGKGTVYFDSLTFRALPEARGDAAPMRATASGMKAGAEPALAIDGDAGTAWVSPSFVNHAGPHALTIDLGASREIGGVSIAWDREHPGGPFDVLIGDDGSGWVCAYRSSAKPGAVSHAPMPDAEGRFIRIDVRPREGEAWGRPVGIAEVTIRPPEFGEANGMYAALARESSRGAYPRPFLGEQRFWTVVGDAEGGEREALLGEDGTVEIERRGYTIEPFLVVNGELVTWADGETEVSLERGYLPMPIVRRRVGGAAGVELEVRAVDVRPPREDAPRTRVEYTVRGTRNQRVAGRLVLAIRPVQVNPPTQWLNTLGGAGRITGIMRSGDAVRVDPWRASLRFERPIEHFGAWSFDEGDVSEHLLAGWPGGTGPAEARDAAGLASGAVGFDFDLAPGESLRTALVTAVPRDETVAGHSARGVDESVWGTAAERWSRTVDRVRFDLPPSARRMWDVARSQIAYILINRDGPAIQPGSRSYERSWARDGSMTSAALLEFGLHDEVRQWIEWFASHQFESGKVPCVVDRRGPDPVDEHDSHGQLIFAAATYHRYTGDAAFARRLWPNVQRAVAYIESIRAARMTEEFRPGPDNPRTRQEPGKPPVPASAFYGLVPESISHEGYSAKPMHSYWDNFFVLLGLKEAAYLAEVVGEPEESARLAALAADFRRTLLDSIAAARAAHGIDYLPGCVELGDFDATSTTIALWPCGEAERLPRGPLLATFERYWEWFVRRRDDATMAWKDYTPYENRVIGTFLRLGQRERALALVDFLFKGMRPAAWNQWPEVVYRDERAPGFLGDVPHTWCGSDYLNAFRAMFVHERETHEGEALVLLAGVPWRWVAEAGQAGLGFEGLPTPYGRLSGRARAHAGEGAGGACVEVEVRGLEREPVGGVWIADPFKDGGPEVRVEGAGPGARRVIIAPSRDASTPK